VRTPEGTTGDDGPVLHLHEPQAFYRRIGADGLIGFGESYMAGEWDAGDLVDVLTVLAAHVTDLVPPVLQRLRGAWARRLPHELCNTPQGARENIHRHYDLSNDLFALFLDETVTYSSALFDALPARRGAGQPGADRRLPAGAAHPPSSDARAGGLPVMFPHGRPAAGLLRTLCVNRPHAGKSPRRRAGPVKAGAGVGTPARRWRSTSFAIL
jgi:hypothetical protein